MSKKPTIGKLERSMNDVMKNLEARKTEKVKTLFDKENTNTTILCSPSDEGVYRNGGRRGAALGPRAILSQFKNLQIGSIKSSGIREIEGLGNKVYKEDFNQAQVDDSEIFRPHIKRNQIIHLGGGHDHAYPLIKALFAQGEKKIHIINVDAHLDTRTDDLSHSGTPFRQLLNEFPENLRITQIGIHEFANAKTNYTVSGKQSMDVWSYDEICNETNHFSKFNDQLLQNRLKINEEECTVFSLDCDALDMATMPAVSAVNHQGLPGKFFQSLLDYYLSEINHRPIVGLYEYNPAYDDLSAKSAKYLASIIWNILKI